MDDLISRQDAQNITGELLGGWLTDGERNILESVDADLGELPSAQRKGRWKKTYLDHEAMGERPSVFYCSCCTQCIAFPTNFCPSCGADMRGDGDG